MNTLIGKSTGIALLLAAALLAALFAMGVFSATGVSAHKDADTNKETHSYTTEFIFTAKGMVDGQLGNIALGGSGKITPKNNDADEQHTYSLKVPQAVETVSVTWKVSGADSGSENGKMEDIELAAAYETKIEIDVSDSKVGNIALPSQTYTFTVTKVGGRLATAKTTPSSNQSLEVQDGTGFARDENIIVELASFGVPSSIDTDDVKVVFTNDITKAVVVSAGTGNPSDIEIDGTTVTLVAPFLVASGEKKGNEIEVVGDGKSTNAGAKITFRRSAGITLPIRHGDYDIEVTNDEEDEDGVQNWVTVRREVSVSPSSGKRGTEITITGKGYSDQTHDIIIGSGNSSLTLTADADDGEFELEVDTAVKNNDGKSVFAGPYDTDTTVAVGDASDTFTIKASFSWSPESPTPGQNITITLSDIDPERNAADDDDVPPTITIGGQAVQDVDDASDTKPSTWKGQVNGDTPLGNRKIAVSVGDTDLPSQNISVGTNDLTVSPTMVVPRQTISIDGDGFTPGSDVDLNDVTVDGVEVNDETGDTEAVNNNGNVSFDITVPEAVNSGPATVKVIDLGNRVGTAEITVAEAEIMVSPAESLRGETVTVSGTGFPANDLVLINYNDATIDTASTSPTGTFSQEVTVPAGSEINPGGKYTIEAVSQINTNDVSDDVEHKIKDPSITITPDTATPGSVISISGENFKGFLRVASIMIGGQNVTPVPAPTTDQWGAFTADNIQVPQLNLTRHAVEVIVGNMDGTDGDATEFLTLVEAAEEPVITTRPVAEVFADLGARLLRVWEFDNATQTWSFYDPRPDRADFNSLTEVSSGDIATIIISSGDPIEFQGSNLYSGTNQIVLK